MTMITQNGHTREFFCGWGAAFINITSTYPMNKVIFRQQLHGIRFHIALSQLRREGLLKLYRGLLPPLMQKTCSVSIMFGMYNYYQQIIRITVPGLNENSRKATSAALAGLTEAVLTPFERVQTLLQDHRHVTRFDNTAKVFASLWRYGATEYYRGASAVICRNSFSNILFFGGRDYLQAAFPSGPDTHAGLRFAQDFVCGAVLGATTSTIMFPLNVIKTRMQSTLGGSHPSMRHTFHSIMETRDGSLRRLFYGVHFNFTRALVSWGIINASYELLKKLLY